MKKAELSIKEDIESRFSDEKKQEILDKVKPELKDNIVQIFELFKDDLDTFFIILDKCKKTGKYDEDIKQTVTAQGIKYFLMDHIGNTEKNAPLLINSSLPIYNITKYVGMTIINKLSCGYIDHIYEELVSDTTGNNSNIKDF